MVRTSSEKQKKKKFSNVDNLTTRANQTASVADTERRRGNVDRQRTKKEAGTTVDGQRTISGDTRLERENQRDALRRNQQTGQGVRFDPRPNLLTQTGSVPGQQQPGITGQAFNPLTPTGGTLDEARRDIVRENIEGRGALDAVNVQRQELDPVDPAPIGLEGLPLLGNVLKATTGIVAGLGKKVGLEGPNALQGEDIFNAEVENIRDKALQKIQVDSFNEGLSANEHFGAIVESIPILGPLARTWIGASIEDPSSNVETIISEINQQRERSINLIEKTRQGFISADESMQTLQGIQDNIARMEGRLQLLINSSAFLRANSDRVNKLETEILRAKQVVEFSRNAVGIEMTRQVSGAGQPVPTDIQLFNELK